MENPMGYRRLWVNGGTDDGKLNCILIQQSAAEYTLACHSMFCLPKLAKTQSTTSRIFQLCFIYDNIYACININWSATNHEMIRFITKKRKTHAPVM
jgi:hypothetical protein